MHCGWISQQELVQCNLRFNVEKDFKFSQNLGISLNDEKYFSYQYFLDPHEFATFWLLFSNDLYLYQEFENGKEGAERPKVLSCKRSHVCFICKEASG